MSDVEHEPIGTRKGFSFTRTPRAGVLVRVKVGEREAPADARTGTEVIQALGVYREVELTAAEWIDVIATVSAEGLDTGSLAAAVELHMGPPSGDGL